MFPELVTDLLKDGYKVSFNAPGHSMYPTILANETVVVEPVEPTAVHKGDIVLYRSNGSLIAHRVMGIVQDDKAGGYSSLLKAFCPEQEPIAPNAVGGGDSPSSNGVDLGGSTPICSSNGTLLFILRGDAIRIFDEPVRSQQILGKVISIERNGASINPYSLRHKLACWVHRWTTRLKRYL
jgi:hypothetical protein